MDTSEEQVRIFRALSEGMNCLGIFVCGPGFAKYRGEAERALARWEADYAPGFREITSHADLWIRGGDAGAFRAAARISELATAGVKLDAPDQLADVRDAVWQLLRSMGPAIPKPPPAERAICEFHGATCPVAQGAELPPSQT